MINKKIMIFIYVILGLSILSFILSFPLTISESFRIVFGSFFVLFLPGFTMSFLFFKKIDFLERMALSFALSLAVVPLLMFYVNLLGVKITLASTLLVISSIIVISVILLYLIERKRLVSR